jgi:hypothetical protein
VPSGYRGVARLTFRVSRARTTAGEVGRSLVFVIQREESSVNTTSSGKPAHRVAAVVAAIVAAASLAAGAQAIQGSASAAPPPCEEWGCGMNHNEVTATTVA